MTVTMHSHGPRRELMEDNVAYHMTTLEQAVVIALLGLWSRNALARVEVKLPGHKLANPEIVSRREEHAIFDRSICDYVPLYWICRTPMQWSRTMSGWNRVNNEDLVFFVFNVGRLTTLSGVVTTDGNAACHESQFWHGWGAWEHLHWEALNYDGPCYGDYKRWKHAEILVLDQIPASFAQAINVCTESAKKRLMDKIATVVEQLQANTEVWQKFPHLHNTEMIDVIVDSKKYFVQT